MATSSPPSAIRPAQTSPGGPAPITTTSNSRSPIPSSSVFACRGAFQLLRLHVGDQLRAPVPELAPPAGEGEGRQRRGGELRPHPLELRALGGQVEGELLNRRLVPDQHHGLDLVRHLAQPSKEILGRRSVQLALDPHLRRIRAPASPFRASRAFASPRSTAPGPARFAPAVGARRSAPMRGDRAGRGGGRDRRGRGRPSSTSRAAGGRGASTVCSPATLWET